MEEQRRGDIVGIGAVVADYIAVLSEFPCEDTKAQILPQSPAEPQLGGPAPVMLAYLSSLGWTTSFVGAVGDDPQGAALKAILENRGVGVDAVVTQEGARTAFAHVWLSAKDGTRTVAFSGATLTPLAVDAVPLDRLLEGAAAVVCDAREPDLAAAAASCAREVSVPVVLDTGNYRPRTRELLPIVDIVQAPALFVKEMSGVEDLVAAAEHVRQQGPRYAVVTDGERGCGFAGPEGRGFVPAFRVDVADSLGAGDIFGAGLIHAVLRGNEFSAAVRFAAAAAALKCARWGKNGLAGEDEILRFLATGPATVRA